MDIKIKQKIAAVFPNVCKIRWQIHQYPELSLKEFRTATLVESELRALGIQTRKIGTGVVGLLRGSKPGKTIALRADMDALPLIEKTGTRFASKVDGVMHACGHDVHTSILLGVAKILVDYKNQLCGNVKFLFQPAEENNPTGGAKLLIEEGALTNPDVDLILGLHVWPDLPVGTIGIRNGVTMAASDRVFIEINGKNSHGSAPHQGVDAITAAAQVVSTLQTIVSRNVNPFKVSVLSFGMIEGGTSHNIIADQVILKGTCRTLDVETRNLIDKRINELSCLTAKAMGASCKTLYVYGYPPLINSDVAYDLLKRVVLASDYQLDEMRFPPLTADDFSFYLEKVPGGFFLLGCTDSEKEKVPLHNPYFLPDEKCLPVGMEVLCRAVLDYLG